MATKLKTNGVDWNSTLVTPPPLFTAGEWTPLLVSDPLSNLTNDSLRIRIKYEELTPVDTLGSFFISAILEVQDEVNGWQPTACHQFAPLRKDNQALERVLIMQPNIDTFSLGVDDSVQVGGLEVCRVSRTNGKLPAGQDYRVVIGMTDNPASPSKLVSVKVTGEVEGYNV